MPDRIAVLDHCVVEQARAAFNQWLQSWVVGVRRTLVVHPDRRSHIIDWVQQQASLLGPPLDLDLVCHGGVLPRRVYYLPLGSGIAHNNVRSWFRVRGLLRKIRVYSCGVESDQFPPGTFDSSSSATQHHLMEALARHSGATVKYSLNTTSGDVLARELSQSFEPDRMRSPTFIADPSGVIRRVR